MAIIQFCFKCVTQAHGGPNRRAGSTSIICAMLASEPSLKSSVKKVCCYIPAQLTSEGFQQICNVNISKYMFIIFLDAEKIVLTKAKRKLARRKDVTSFDSYMTAVLDRSNILQQCPDAREKLQQIYDDHKDIFPIIEPFTVSTSQGLLVIGVYLCIIYLE